MALEQIHRYAPRPRYSPAARRRRTRVLVVVGVFLGFVAAAWAWAFHRGPEALGGDVPVLSAGSEPTREKPTDPGGMKVVDIDPLSYDSGRAPPKIENILPAPETPLPPPPPAPPKAAAAPVPPAPTAQPATAVANVAAPTKPAAAPATGKPVAQSEVPAKPIATARAVVAPSVKPRPPKLRPVALREEAKPEARPAPPAAGNYRIQLASLRSAADAHASATKLRGRFGDVLGGVSFNVVTVDLPGRGTYYRVMTGSMSQGAASHICETLRQRGAACLLAR